MMERRGLLEPNGIRTWVARTWVDGTDTTSFFEWSFCWLFVVSKGLLPLMP